MNLTLKVGARHILGTQYFLKTYLSFYLFKWPINRKGGKRGGGGVGKEGETSYIADSFLRQPQQLELDKAKDSSQKFCSGLLGRNQESKCLSLHLLHYQNMRGSWTGSE